MKAVYVEKPNSVSVIDVPKPEITREDEVLVRVIAGGICGSDIGIYTGTNALATYPRIIGHEFGGRVEAVGSGVKGIKVGDIVAVDPVRSCGHCYACTHGHPNVCKDLQVCGVHRDGGFAEYAVAPEANVYVIDTEKVPAELSCAVEPYSIGAEVCAQAAVGEGDKVLIMGSGPIGICIMQVAKAHGAQVMMTDLLDARLERARAMGADRVVQTERENLADAVAEFTDGEGMPVIVDSVCQDWTLNLATQLASPAGRIVPLGTADKWSSIRQLDIVKKELTIVGSRLNNRRFPEVIRLMEEGKLTPKALITNSFPVDRVEEALQQVITQKETECKVALSF